MSNNKSDNKGKRQNFQSKKSNSECALVKKNQKRNYHIGRFTKKSIPKLRYGVLHSLFGYSDGVSIVMEQIEEMLNKGLNVPLSNIKYLVGKSKKRSPRITTRKIVWQGYSVNRLMLRLFEEGYGGWYNESIEKAISEAVKEIHNFIEKNKIDVIIAHNSAHPVNFISSIALSRYYRYAEDKGNKTPKYVLWWHDSHLERPRFHKPANDVERYLLEGVPGIYVEFILFINSLQFSQAQKYFNKLDNIRPGFYECMHQNHDVIYNTTSTFIDSYDDLKSERFDERIETFINDFKIRDKLKKKGLTLSDVFFCLQHTRVVHRKRIDFALRFCFELHKDLLKRKRKKKYKAIYFFVSGHSSERGVAKTKLKRLYKKLCKEYNTDKVILSFVEDVKKTSLSFEEYPRIFAKLGGISTYFSEIEGFGNNLLEVMASGLIPVIYTYPVFKEDIAKYKFKVVDLKEFQIDDDAIERTVDIIFNQRKRKIWINRNLQILRKNFSHQIIARKLQRGIIRRRMHK